MTTIDTASTDTTLVRRTAHIDLPFTLASVSAARHFVAGLLVDWDLEVVTEAALLCVSELAANAVAHAQSGPVVDVVFDGREVRIGVSDTDRELPVLRPMSLSAPGGRGVAIIEEYSTSSWVEATSTGKTVWCAFSTSC